jgi:hypothetical protein
VACVARADILQPLQLYAQSLGGQNRRNPRAEKRLRPWVACSSWRGDTQSWGVKGNPLNHNFDCKDGGTEVGKVFIPAKAADDWRSLLADPDRHWRTGYSARTLAHCWQEADDFPPSVRQALESSGAFAGLELLLAIPEVKTPLPGGSRPTQTDLLALARCDAGLISVAVEGKAAEPFGPTLGEWQTDGEGRQVRLAFLLETLGLRGPLDPSIRYQLLHRTAAAVLEAQRFLAPHAVMLVQAFGLAEQSFADFAAFSALFEAQASVGQVVTVGQRGGVSLYLGWCAGDERFLRA